MMSKSIEGMECKFQYFDSDGNKDQETFKKLVLSLKSQKKVHKLSVDW